LIVTVNIFFVYCFAARKGKQEDANKLKTQNGGAGIFLPNATIFHKRVITTVIETYF